MRAPPGAALGIGGVSAPGVVREPAALADGLALTVLGLGYASLALPTGWRLATTVWPTEAQGHGPLILALSLWMAWTRLRKGPAVEPAAGPDTAPMHARGAGLLLAAGWAAGLMAYILGRSQAVLMLEVGALVALTSLLVLQLGGAALWRRLAFPLLFLVFLVPLPEAFVAAVTAPLKASVSAAATGLLQAMGAPVGRTGVMITAGPYQLLVADACAGLHTLFTLEAMGLVYLQWRQHPQVWRNVTLALLLMPIAWVANVVRVMALVGVTLAFGDAAGRGYAHEAAGYTLFVAAVLLMLATDTALGGMQRWWRGRAAKPSPARGGEGA